MSDQAAPPAAPAADHTGPPPSAGQGADPYKIHDHATKASAELEAIATALGHAGAPEKVTASFTKMAEACRALQTSMSRAPAPPPKASEQPRETMDSATNDLANQARR